MIEKIEKLRKRETFSGKELTREVATLRELPKMLTQCSSLLLSIASVSKKELVNKLSRRKAAKGEKVVFIGCPAIKKKDRCQNKH